MTQRLYLYLDNISFSDCCSSNSILCERLAPNEKGAKPLSRNTEDYLFLTHKKLDAASRTQGIANGTENWPVVMELTFEQDDYEKFPVVFLKQGENGPVLELGELKDYEEKQPLGCYVFAELPFFAVSKVLFGNQDQLITSDKSVSPDFLWKHDLNTIIDEKEFTDKLQLTLTEEQIDTCRKKGEEAVLTGESAKYKAAILHFINGTKCWKMGKYQTSFDFALLRYFGIDKESVTQALMKKGMPIPANAFEESSEKLNLIPQQLKKDGSDQGIYNIIVSSLIDNTAVCDSVTVQKLLSKIKSELVKCVDSTNAGAFEKALDAIESCCLRAMGVKVDSLFQQFEEMHFAGSILKTLFFIFKNPNDFRKFINSLELYHVDSVTKRRAMVLWGFLNGMHHIPANGYNRENKKLWKTVEWSSSKFFNSNFHFVLKKPEIDVENPYGIEIYSEEVVTLEEAQTFFAGGTDRLPDEIYIKIYNLAKTIERSKFRKNDPYYYFNVEEIGKQLETMKRVSKADLNAYVKALKALKPEYDHEVIFKDWVEDAGNFKKVWDALESELKPFYLKMRG